jgi:hypothetical protein
MESLGVHGMESKGVMEFEELVARVALYIIEDTLL